MKLLAIESATATCSVALLVDGQIEERMVEAAREHTQHLLPMVDGLLSEAGVALSALDALVVGQGPGAFTGLRVAVGVAQGLAFGADIPVVPVSSLAVLAQGVFRQYGHENVLAALDARMDEVYWGVMGLQDSCMVALEPECVCAPEQLSVPTGTGWYAAGPGWAEYGDRIVAATQVQIAGMDAALRPRARDALALGERAFRAEQYVAAEQALPRYLRNTVAWQRR